MRVVIVKPEKIAYEKEIGDSLESMQQVVGGFIEAIYPFEDQEVALVCNEEGKIKGLPLNRALYSPDNKKQIIDIVAGTFFVCAAPSNSGNFESLTFEQVIKYLNRFHDPEGFYRKSDNTIGVFYY